MKTDPKLFPGAVLLMAIAVSSFGLAQDPKGSTQDPPAEPIEERQYEYGGEMMPILGTAAEYGSLMTLLELLRQSGLDSELKGDGPFTLFAPDDSAFAQLDPEQLEKLMSDREYAKAVLSRHVVTGHPVEFGDGPQALTIKSVSGDAISVEVTEEAVRVEQAWVLDEQIECSNGVIHVIDAVLLPPKGKHKG